MTADEFGRRMHHNVCAVFKRAYQIGGGKGGIHHQRNFVCVRYRRHFFNVDQSGVGVADGFNKQRLRVAVDRVFKRVFLVRVHKGGGDTILGQGVLQQVVGTAVNGFGGDDVVARAGEVQEGVGDRRRTGRHAQRRHAAFQRRNALLKSVHRGVGQTAVNVARVRQTEPCRRVSRVFEHIRSGLINRYCAGIGHRVRLFLSGVQLNGFEFVVVIISISHSKVPLCFII